MGGDGADRGAGGSVPPEAPEANLRAVTDAAPWTRDRRVPAAGRRAGDAPRRSRRSSARPRSAELGLVDAVVDHVELTLGTFPPDLRAATVARRTRPGAPRACCPAVRATGSRPWWSARSRLRRTAARAIKALFAIAAYEQRAVKDRMGYRPEDWIERTAAPPPGAVRRRHPHGASWTCWRPLRWWPGACAEGGTVGRVRRRAAGGWTEAGGRPLELTCDVVVVGSGAGGAVVAAELAEAGLDVVVLEEGGHHTTEEFTPDSSAMVRMLYRDGGATFARGRPPVQFAEGRCVGGSTTMNGGMCWRTPERVLERWAREDGVDGIAPGDMERYFERVERFVSAAPQDPGSVGRDNELLREGADALGWRVVHNQRAQIHCAGCNTCTFGCPTGAKRSTLVVVPAARGAVRRAGPLRLPGRPRGVRRPPARGRRRRASRGRRASTVPRARRGRRSSAAARSRRRRCSQRSGVRSPSGRLGHNLSLHPNAKVVAFFDEDVVGFQGAHQAYQVREFEDQGLVFAAVNLPPGLLASTLPQYGARARADDGATTTTS